MARRHNKKTRPIPEDQLNTRKQAKAENEAHLLTFCQYTSCKAPKEMIVINDWKEFLDGKCLYIIKVF